MEESNKGRTIKIAVTGPESTGKSELCRKMSEQLKCDWVPEYAREYLHEHGLKYRLEDLISIAEGQRRLEGHYIEPEPGILVFDTEMTVIKIWAEVVFGEVPPQILKWQKEQEFDYYLLCDIDVPWTSDPMREHPHKRKELFEHYLMEMEAMHYPFGVVSGTGDERMKNALGLLVDSGILP